MKTDDLGALLLLVGTILFFSAILIECYKHDMLLGIAITGVVMIVLAIFLIVNSKTKTDDNNE